MDSIGISKRVLVFSKSESRGARALRKRVAAYERLPFFSPKSGNFPPTESYGTPRIRTNGDALDSSSAARVMVLGA